MKQRRRTEKGKEDTGKKKAEKKKLRNVNSFFVLVHAQVGITVAVRTVKSQGSAALCMRQSYERRQHLSHPHVLVS